MAYQANCNKQGFNLPNDIFNDRNTSIKLGIGMNNQDDCHSCNTAISIGSNQFGARNLCVVCVNPPPSGVLHNYSRDNLSGWKVVYDEY